MGLSVINYKEKAIIVTDYSNFKTKEEMIGLLHEAADYIRKSPKQNHLSLTDVTNARVHQEFMNEAKYLNKEVFGPNFSKSAILGITGLKKILLMGYNTASSNKMVPFNTREEALEYLVK